MAQLAAAHASEQDFAGLARTIARQRELAARADGELAAGDDAHFLQLDMQFLLCLARATKNATVTRLIRSLFTELELARDLAIHGALVPDWSIDVHEWTLAAVRSGDMALIDRVMDEHVAVLEDTWQRQSGRPVVRPLPEFLRAVADRRAF